MVDIEAECLLVLTKSENSLIQTAYFSSLIAALDFAKQVSIGEYFYGTVGIG